MKIAVIVYHKNVTDYQQQWISQFTASILNQTYKQFDIYELDYGGVGFYLFNKSKKFSQEMANHICAMNFLLDKCFADGYDYVLNTNIDDWYHPDRIKKQTLWMTKHYDIISSNFIFVDKEGKQFRRTNFDKRNFAIEARRGHNIIAHPVVAYSRNFWLTCNRYDENSLGDEDFKLWKQSYGKYKFVIEPAHLLYYRIHSNQTGKIYAKRPTNNPVL